MKLKYFYKIENDKLIKGSGYKIPGGFVEYDINNKPNEFLEYDIAYLKTKLKQQIKSEFTKRYEKSVIHSDQIDEDIDAGVEPLRNINGLIDVLADDDKIDYRLANNDFKEVSKDDLIEMKKEMIKAGQGLFATKWDLENQVDGLADEDVELTVVDFENQSIEVVKEEDDE